MLLESHPVLVEFIDSNPSALEFLHNEQSHADLNTLALILSLQRIYGGNLVVRLQGISSVSSRFIELYGDGQITVLHAPARINILGEHIDYVSYLPTASLTLGSREHDMLMLFRGSAVSKVRGASTDPEYPSFVFDFGNEPSDASGDTRTDWASFLSQHPAGPPNWANYVKGAIEFARFKFGTKLTKGFDFLVDSTVPAGSGASSSSALVVLASAAVRESNKIRYKAEQLALDASKAEWYVGTRGGAMDHITICLARLRHAVLINYQANHARTIMLPAVRFRWVTFFSSPAEKSRAVMVEYNERAAVSRVVIPALIETWKTSDPARYEMWQQTMASLDAGSWTAIEIAGGLLETLPATISLDQLENVSPAAVAELRSSFPALVEQRCNVPLQVRSRAFHHLGEIRRVARAIAILDSSKDTDIDSSMHSLGKLLNDSHASLRDLYGVSTTDLEELIEIIRSDSNVYGSRLMGGGFGGNVLAITQENSVSELIEKVQNEYYRPRGRNALEEGSVMVSTAGDGLMELQPDIVWREALEEFNSLDNQLKYRNDVVSMLDHVSVAESTIALVPIVVAAGKGSRAQRTGLEVAKPLAMVLGVPSIVHVIRNIRTGLKKLSRPIVIVSPDTDAAVRAALAGEEVSYVLQRQPFGTGDAVLSAADLLAGFQGRVLVVWSTQPVIRPETIRRTSTIAHLLDEYDMILPTTFKERPYAPLVRDDCARVKAAYETHSENLERPSFGETNIGLFLLKSKPMFETLGELRRRYWDESCECYDRPRGELGFPNELINEFGKSQKGVFACAIAASEEEQGIKELADIERCERIILQNRASNEHLP